MDGIKRVSGVDLSRLGSSGQAGSGSRSSTAGWSPLNSAQASPKVVWTVCCDDAGWSVDTPVIAAPSVSPAIVSTTEAMCDRARSDRRRPVIGRPTGRAPRTRSRRRSPTMARAARRSARQTARRVIALRHGLRTARWCRPVNSPAGPTPGEQCGRCQQCHGISHGSRATHRQQYGHHSTGRGTGQEL